MAINDITDLIRARRTIYDFKPEVPPREALLRAIEAARWAPNHRLTEPWRFYLLGRETAEAIATLNAELVSAKKGPEAGAEKLKRWRAMPGWLVVTCENSADPIRAREDYAACCCAIQNLMLALWGEGIGVKWNTGKVIEDPRFYDLIWVDPTVETVVGLFWYGYPAEVPETRRKSVDEILIDLP
jgi:nitroreductase